ncbi:hypothetical protein ACIPY3_11815 [Paenarthrobacter sp. NPDC089714]|uniref:hypothetical protein n=1 Tax=Paenarthrobacter sp. NPDC089714 TaxID=3364377 RepID=UPI003830A8D0
MPYQAETSTIQDPAHRAGASQAALINASPIESAAPAVRVIPVVDLVHGTVIIAARGRAERFHHPEPRLLAAALARSVRAARWCSASQTLTVTVAAVGRAAGRERLFNLVPAA